MADVLIAIDPGDITGYVVMDLATNTVVESHEISGWMNTCDKFEIDIQWYGPTTLVVMERFIINATTHKKTNQEAPRDIIGTIKWLTHKHTGRACNMQSAGEAKSFATNERLKAVEMIHKGGKGHANDAFRHALVFMINRLGFKDRRLLLDSGEE